MKLPWTRTEKWLWAAPVLLGVGAYVLIWGPRLARKVMGYPTLLEVPGSTSPLSISFSTEGANLVALYRGNKVSIWDARTLHLQKIWPIPVKTVSTVSTASDTFPYLGLSQALSPQQRKLFFVSGQMPVFLFDLNSQKKVWAFGHPTTYPSSAHARYSADGGYVGFTQQITGGIRYVVLNATTGKLVSSWKRNLYISEATLDFSPDEKTVANIGAGTHTTFNFRDKERCNIELRRVQDGTLLRTIMSPWSEILRFSPDGAHLIVIADIEPRGFGGVRSGQKVVCFSVTTGQALWSYGGGRGDSYNAAICSPDRTQVAVYQNFPPTIVLLDAHTGALQRTLQVGGDEVTSGDHFDSMVFSTDAKRLFACGKSGILVWDLD